MELRLFERMELRLPSLPRFGGSLVFFALRSHKIAPLLGKNTFRERGKEPRIGKRLRPHQPNCLVRMELRLLEWMELRLHESRDFAVFAW